MGSSSFLSLLLSVKVKKHLGPGRMVGNEAWHGETQVQLPASHGTLGISRMLLVASALLGPNSTGLSTSGSGPRVSLEQDWEIPKKQFHSSTKIQLKGLQLFGGFR